LGKADARLAGVLSRDQLFQYDLDIDFANGVLKLFSPDHCQGNVLYWKAAAVAVGEFDTGGGHINVQVTLDGQKLNAIIDSGSINSVLSADVARRWFGLTADSPGMKQSGMAANDPQYPVYQREFSELDFNGVAARKPVMTIWPNVINRNSNGNLRNIFSRAIPMSAGIAPPQMIIGMDILSKLHIYFAFREHHMYVSAANSPSSK
jgi:hypothetical protein